MGGSDSDEISTTEAATILGLSMPLLTRKMDIGELPFRQTPEGRVARMSDVLALKDKLDKSQKALRALAEDTEELIAFLENSSPVSGSGSFLKDRGHSDPVLSKEKLLIAGKIRILAEKSGLDAAGIVTVLKAIGTDAPSVEGIDAVLRGQVAKFSLDTLKTVLAWLEKQR